jgi:hypothetical protein
MSRERGGCSSAANALRYKNKDGLLEWNRAVGEGFAASAPALLGGAATLGDGAALVSQAPFSSHGTAEGRDVATYNLPRRRLRPPPRR